MDDKKKKSLQNLKPFKKGISGNPSGRSPLSPEEKKLRKMTKEQFKEVGDLIVNGKWDELEDVESDPNATVIQRMVCKALIVAHGKGDWHTVNLLLDRLIGRVKEEIDISLPKPTVILLGDGKEIILGAKKGDEE